MIHKYFVPTYVRRRKYLRQDDITQNIAIDDGDYRSDIAYDGGQKLDEIIATSIASLAAKGGG